MKNLRLVQVLLGFALGTTALAQQQWRFPIAFEDAIGAKDTIWFVYDTTATVAFYVDTALGEGEVVMDMEAFNVFLMNWDGDSTKTQAFPYSIFPIGEIYGIKGINCVPPLVVRWDTLLFSSPVLPSTPTSYINRARIASPYFYFTGEGTDLDSFSMFYSDSVVISDPTMFFAQLAVGWDYVSPLSITEVGLVSLRISPNPANDRVAIFSTEQVTRVDMIDPQGRLVHQEYPNSYEFVGAMLI